MRNSTLIFLFILTTSSLFARKPDSTRTEKPESLPRWTLYFPGASYYYQKNYLKGTAFATREIGGVYLGIKHGYNIGPAVAAHMWYDAVLMLGSFLINPEENFPGVNVRLGIN